MSKRSYPAHPEVPISKAVRAGDFVFTSAYGPWTFDPLKVVFDENGAIVDDGSGHKNVPFEEQVHLTFGFVRDALAVAGCTLEDVISCECWLADARDFVAFNKIYRQYFTRDPPVRSVFPVHFMFDVKVEMKVIAYKPLSKSQKNA
ncbi:MAG TPA: RidA family protein [Aestuariivirgaceae bacterium]|jgi:enamine deaminase RidA (YjgF/YER057c/UK114 family)